MIALALDTATKATVVGLSLADGTVLEARDDPAEGARPGHATRLLPLAAALLDDAGVAWSQLERIVVGVGPGTFTGLRVGIATAHGLAQSLGVALFGVSSLDALAVAAADRGDAVLAAIDARRGEVFLAGYQEGVETLTARPIAPEQIAALPSEHAQPPGERGWLAVGDGALLYRQAFAAAGAEVPEEACELHRIRAHALCELAARATPATGPVLPDYLRRPDAALALGAAG